MTEPSPAAPRITSVRLIAIYEAAKAVLVLAAGFGLLTLLHGDTRQAATTLLTHLHLNPAHETEQVFLDAAGSLTDTHLWLLAAGSLLYAVVRSAEAWGLWWDRRWAEWLGAVSGALYMPFELVAFAREPSLRHALFFIMNGLIVGYLARRLAHRRRRARQPS
jgi:uncharacterized membrane protein (DUF2068 family)